MTAVAEALEALGHPQGAIPERRLLANLFVRFQAQVPLRCAPAGVDAEDLLAAWLEEGSGCCGEGRLRVFEALASAAGFALESGTARDGGGTQRRVLFGERRHLLLDPGFPLPAPLSLDPPAEPEATGYGNLSARAAGEGGVEVLLETRGEERTLFRVEPGGPPGRAQRAPEDAAEKGPESTANPQGDPGEHLFRLLDDRLLRWCDGILEISDAWSRLRVPFPASDADGLEALFGPPVPPATEAEKQARPSIEPRLAVYHSADADASHLLRLLADPAAHARLLPNGWTVEDLSLHADGFERRLVEEEKLLRCERVTARPDGIVVESEGPLALFRTRTWRLESRPGGTRLRLLAKLRDPVPPRGLPEGTRRRLVFELASELLALDRLAAEG